MHLGTGVGRSVDHAGPLRDLAANLDQGRHVNFQQIRHCGWRVTDFPGHARGVQRSRFPTVRHFGTETATIRAVLSHVEANPDLLAEIAERDEETLRSQLTAIKGIGPWSADMFLMFGLGKLDVLPVGDLGLRMGVRDQYGLKEVPTSKEILVIGEKWKPYCSIATWYIWRSRGFVPQSGE